MALLCVFAIIMPESVRHFSLFGSLSTGLFCVCSTDALTADFQIFACSSSRLWQRLFLEALP